MGGSASVPPRMSFKSNAELLAGLHTNMEWHRKKASECQNGTEPKATSAYQSWTTKTCDDLYVPAWTQQTGLSEERSAYDITVKLFYLPNAPTEERSEHTKDAIAFVLKELKVSSVDLLIISFPGVTFDADDEFSDDEDSTKSDAQQNQDADQEFDSILSTWRTLESLQATGMVQKLGLAEFGTHRLSRLLSASQVRPSVDQINVRDCCVVPKPLIVMARKEKIELLTHNDCTDILPSGTLRELLSTKGIEVLKSTPTATDADAETGLGGNIEGLWVVKYTAVVKNRGVVENKGYFAAAKLQD
jgi:glutamate--cysteine ligase regulatory subunit